METKENTIAYLERLFNALTTELKEMESGDSGYESTWNERADISRQLAELRK